MEKLNKLKFAVSGGLTMSVFVVLVEIFLWIKFIPLYNSVMINLYGVSGISTGFLLFLCFLFIILGFILGFALLYLFAMIYNRLPEIKLGQ